jgi:LysR family transcriptional regulator, regulator for bpeEF and oprC
MDWTSRGPRTRAERVALYGARPHSCKIDTSRDDAVWARVNGVPRHPRDLARHHCLGYLCEGRPSPFGFASGADINQIAISGPLHANDADVLVALALAGSGIVLLFDFLVAQHVADGRLVTVLDEHASLSWPVQALYPKNRHLLPKVRVFLDLLTTLCRGHQPSRPSAGRRCEPTPLGASGAAG